MMPELTPANYIVEFFFCNEWREIKNEWKGDKVNGEVAIQMCKDLYRAGFQVRMRPEINIPSFTKEIEVWSKRVVKEFQEKNAKKGLSTNNLLERIKSQVDHYDGFEELDKSIRKGKCNFNPIF